MITLEELYDYWTKNKPIGSAIELTYGTLFDESGSCLDISVIANGRRNIVATLVEQGDEYTFVHELDGEPGGFNGRMATCKTYKDAINMIITCCYETSQAYINRLNRIVDGLKHDLEAHDEESV